MAFLLLWTTAFSFHLSQQSLNIGTGSTDRDELDNDICSTNSAINANIVMMVEVTGRRSLGFIRVFENLDRASLSRLNNHCRWRTHEPGSDFVDLGDNATDVHFLTDGLARVVIHTSRGKDVAFRTIEAGDVFGEFAAIDGGPRSASVEILKPSVIGSMSAQEFRTALVNEPELNMALLMQLTGEIRRLTSRVLEFSTLAVANRIQSELLRLAGDETNPNGDVLIRPAPKHALIASRVSTHREAVTKELGRLTRLCIIERRGPDLAVTDIERLTRMVRDASNE